MSVEKKNIFLHDTIESLPYTSSSGGPVHAYPNRADPSAHADYIAHKLRACNDSNLTQKQVAAIRYKDGVYLEFQGAVGCDLNIKSLENIQQGIRLLNVRFDEKTKTVSATVYIPAGKESYFLNKVEQYAKTSENMEKPRNNDLVRSIENVSLAVLDSFWVGKKESKPEVDDAWCEVWLRFEDSEEDASRNFESSCQELGIEVSDQIIVFPERIVRLAKANNEKLVNLIKSCDYLAEIRRAPEKVTFFDEMSGSEQQEWIQELLGRCYFNETGATVCLLDQGISAAHPLISPATKDKFVLAVRSEWGVGDDQGHGTEMAGIALYRDLQECLEGTGTVEVNHQLESVKILPPRGKNQPELYGAITERAISLIEIANPFANRSICMAITSSEYNTEDGSPTSWSAALDNITSGASGDGTKRLFFVSAGNVYPYELKTLSYPDSNILHRVENPGQSWNALTVGAYTNEIAIGSDSYQGFSPVADVGDLSPFSSTSMTWSSKWPIKPEILLDGGNVATNGIDYTECPDLSLLTTGKDHLMRPFSTICATSSATAQAAWMAAQIYAEYPQIWPETVRALIVQSARWTEKMRAMFCKEDNKTRGRRKLLRTCGYGIPDVDRAKQCLNNSVNMIIQGELQPYETCNGTKRMKEMHIHKIPWPAEVLRELGDTEAEMRVTLSYFVEPGPGEKGWKDRYRYPSCGLRFDVINTDENLDDFKKRINIQMRGEDKKDSGAGTSGSERWYLGADNRDVGSIHSDFISCNAVDLCNANYLAVYPVVGWWRERSHLGKIDSTIRYALVVSILTPKEDVDLYTAITTKITTEVSINLPVL